MSIFGTSQTEKHVIALTSETLRDADVSGNIELADEIKRASDDGKQILKYLIKRIQHKNPHVQQLALQLLDLCVKNCHTAFHQHLATKDHLKVLCEIAVDKKVPQHVRDYVLTLLESWNEAFTQRPNEFQLPIFGEFYMKLKRKGVEFPARDMSAMAPVQTPSSKLRPTTQQRRDEVAGANPYLPADGGGYQPPQMHSPQQQPQQQYPQQPYPQQQPYPGMHPQQPGQYMQPMHPQQYPIAQPVYAPPNAMYQYPPGQVPQMQAYPIGQQPPQQQQQQPQLSQRERDLANAAQKRAQLTPAQVVQYQQCTYLSSDYITKIRSETTLTFEYISLLKDLSSAADSPQALKADPLASNLQRVLEEVRNRFTRLILELGDILSPESADAAEFLIDLSIRMIDSIRSILDYHKFRCDGIANQSPPIITMPRALIDGMQRRPSPAPAQSSVKLSPGPEAAGAGAVGREEAAPREMQLFDIPVVSVDDDEKQVADIFAQHRPKKSQASPRPSPLPYSPQPYQPAAASSSSPAASAVDPYTQLQQQAHQAAMQQQYLQQPMPYQPSPYQPQQQPQQQYLAPQAASSSPPKSVPSSYAILSQSNTPEAKFSATHEESIRLAAADARAKRFESSPHFSPHESFQPVGDRIVPSEASSSSTASQSSPPFQGMQRPAEDVNHATPVAQPLTLAAAHRAEPTPFDESPQPDQKDQEEGEIEGGAAQRTLSVDASDAGGDSYDILAPMRSGEAQGQVLLRAPSNGQPEETYSSSSSAAAAEAAPSSSASPGANAPGGPQNMQALPSHQLDAHVDDNFLDDLMAFTIPQKEGQ